MNILKIQLNIFIDFPKISFILTVKHILRYKYIRGGDGVPVGVLSASRRIEKLGCKPQQMCWPVQGLMSSVCKNFGLKMTTTTLHTKFKRCYHTHTISTGRSRQTVFFHKCPILVLFINESILNKKEKQNKIPKNK